MLKKLLTTIFSVFLIVFSLLPCVILFVDPILASDTTAVFRNDLAPFKNAVTGIDNLLKTITSLETAQGSLLFANKSEFKVNSKTAAFTAGDNSSKMRVLFNAQSDTIQKRFFIKTNYNTASIDMELDNASLPFKQFTTWTPALGDLQVYKRSTDTIVYRVSQSPSTASVKEWIQAKTYNYQNQSRYVWKLSSPDKNYKILLKQQSDNRIFIYRTMNISGIDNSDHKKRFSAMETVRKALKKQDINIKDQEFLGQIEPLVYWTNNGLKKTAQYSIVDDNNLIVQINEPLSAYPLLIDPTVSISWGQWLGGSGSDRVTSIAVNNDKIYVGGYSDNSSAWETISWQGAHSGGQEGFVIKITDNGSTPTINWGQWLGGNGTNYITALAVNNDKIYIGGHSNNSSGWETIPWQGFYSGNYEGFVIKITDNGSTPTISWGQWLGGGNHEYIYSIAINDNKIYVGGMAYNYVGWNEIIPQGDFGGTYEGFVIKITDGVTPTINWGQWLGGSSNDSVTALAVNNDKIYVGGYSYSSSGWETISWQGTYSGSYEGFVIKITDGVTPTINWGQWLGGLGDDYINALAINNDKIYVGGHSNWDSNWETIPWQGICASFDEGFVIKITDGVTPTINWGQWLGGSQSNQVTALAINNDKIYAGGYSNWGDDWETISWQGIYTGFDEGFVIKITDGTIPTINWGQWLGGSGYDYINALAINNDKIYVGGYSDNSSAWETISWQGAHSGGQEGFVIKLLESDTNNAIFFGTDF